MIKLYKGAPFNAFCKLTVSFFFFKIHIVQLMADWHKAKGWGIVIQKWPYDPYRMAYLYLS